MSLKLTTQNKQSKFNKQLSLYGRYTNELGGYSNLQSENYEHQILNYVFMETLIDRYNYYKNQSLKELKKGFNDYSKREFKECGYKFNNKDDIIRWLLHIPHSLSMENKNQLITPSALRYFIDFDDLVGQEEIEEKFYNVYVYPTFKKYINLMRDLKPFLNDIKDNTIICKNEEIFTIILLARNNKFTINYYAMKNIISYL
jgi:hypothetical protein